MKAIQIKDEMCDKWLSEDCDYDDCAFAQIEPAPNSAPHPKCPLPDWPSVSRNEVVEMFDVAVGIMGKGTGANFIVDKLCSVGIIIKDEAE